MWTKLTALALSSVLLLASCGGGSTPNPIPPPDTQLTEANAWKGDIPADAQTVTPEEFKQGLASGEFVLTPTSSLEAQKAAQEKQYQDDKSFLSGLPDKSPYIQKLLEEATLTAGVDPDHPVKVAAGQEVLLMGLATQLRNAVEAEKRAQSVDNALEDYTQSYALLPQGLKSGAATPDSLKDKSLSEVKAASSALSTQLSSVPNLDGTRLDTEVGPTSLPGNLSSQAVNAGNGVDHNGPCTPTGLVKKYWFPLKKFVSPIKNQANRGTCWAFAAIGALESRERVQSNNPVNLSEQFLVNKVKQDWDASDNTDGYWSDKALQTALSKGQVFPGEGAWTYNPANSRNYPKYDKTCDGYSGTCSNTAHESRRTCTTFIFTFCSYVKVTFGGPGTASSNTTLLWTNGKTFDLNLYRLRLAQGYTLLADFPVYVGVMDRAAGGVVSDYNQTKIDDKGKEVAGSYGGHAVQLVGFLSNDALTQFGNPSSVGGGGYFILKNSWGCGGGDGGYYYVPADYVSKYFGSLRTLNFGGQRSDAWNKEQATPGGTDAPLIAAKNQPARVDLRVETDLAKFFTVSHPVAKSVNLTVTSSVDGTLYNGPWSTDTNALFGTELKRSFATEGPRNINLVAKYGSSQFSRGFVLTVVNTPPKIVLSFSGDPRQGEDYPIAAQIVDLNETDSSKLCANTVWSVDAPDTLSSISGCTVKFKGGAQGARTVRVSTKDTEGETDAKTFTLNVLPPPENPFPRIKSSGVYSREFTTGGTFSFCGSPAVASGATIDMTKKGCNFLIGQPAPSRYFAGVDVENPDKEVLTYDWKLLVREFNGGDFELLGAAASSAASLELEYNSNGVLVTGNDCRVTLKVNAPDPRRSKSLTVWTGKCTYRLRGPS